MTTIKKLSRMPYAQAHVEIYDDEIVLFSYVTKVVSVDNDGFIHLTPAFDCSQTTRKHVSAFLREYCSPIEYSNAKSCYYDGYNINYRTGEVVPR